MKTKTRKNINTLEEYNKSLRRLDYLLAKGSEGELPEIEELEITDLAESIDKYERRYYGI